MGIHLVTGGAGFIGSHLVEELLNRRREVRILDNFSSGRKENLAHLNSSFQLIRGDILDQAAVKRSMRGVSHVFHLAAVSSVPLSVDKPLDTFEANLKGTWQILEAARHAGARRVVFISSASVYGADAPTPFKESLPLKGSSPYAASKLVGEQLCELYYDLYGLETAAVRLFSVYGPRQNPYSHYANVIPAFATRVLRGEQPTIYGDGRQTRDFIYVKDVVKALMKASRLKAAVGEVVNVGSGRQTSIVDLLELIQRVLGTHVQPIFAPKKPGDDPRTCAHTAKAKKVLGIDRITRLESGLKPTCLWFKNEMSR